MISIDVDVKRKALKEKILVTAFFIAIFVNFLGPIIDPDFPFHLKTGEYIYEHRGIPDDDPFSFYGEGTITEREKFTLSQYWIAQIIFYKLYSAIGPPGIIVLRAIVFSAFVILLFFALRGKGFYLSLIITALVAVMLQASKVDRPQFFSFFFMLVCVLLIERFRERPESTIPLYFIPPLMLLWANMHAGFVFGIAVILIYALSETLKFFTNKSNIVGQSLPARALFLFLLIILITVLSSYINPIADNQLLTTIESHTEASWLYDINREYISPIQEISVYFGNRTSVVIFFFIFAFVSIVACLHAVRTKSVDVTILTLIFFSATAAFNAVRYIPFFIAIALPLSKNYSFFTNEISFKHLRGSIGTFVLFLILFMGAIVYGVKDGDNVLKLGHPSNYPEGAAKFLLDNRMDGNIFNQHNRGSYFIWRLYPYYRVFNDSRFISLEAVYDTDAIAYALEDHNRSTTLSLGETLAEFVPKELGAVKVSSGRDADNERTDKPLWKRLLKQYKIDIIVHEATADFTKAIYPLTLRLLKDDDWVLIYLDGTTQIFVRNREKYADIIRNFKKPKELIYDEIIFETIPLVNNKVGISTPYSSLAFAFMMKGRDEDARRLADAALELDKNDITAHFCKAYLALKQRNSNITKQEHGSPSK